MMRVKIHLNTLPTSVYYNLVDLYQICQAQKQVYQHYQPHHHPPAFPLYRTIHPYPTLLVCR